MKSQTAVWLERTRIQRGLRYIFCAGVISLSVQLMLLPLMVVYFHRVSLSAIVLNIAVSALLGLLTCIATLALAIEQVSQSLAVPFVTAANFVNLLMINSVEPFTRLGLDSIRLPEYTSTLRTIYFFFYVPLFLLLIGISRWHPVDRPKSIRSRSSTYFVAGVLQSVLVAVVLFHPLSAATSNGELRVDFLDVGQGDSALVTMPDGTTVLVDGGGRPNFAQSPNERLSGRELRSIGETVVSEYLWWRGLDRVDYVLATHADADHIDGLNDVVRNFAVRGAIVARTPPNHSEFTQFASTLKIENIPLITVESGDVIWFGPVSTEVVSPRASGDSSGNDDSIVLRLKFGSRAILLTGDIEKKAESLLVNSGREFSADVVKVPHHGSRTSSTEPFVALTRASVAIISVGLTSVFSHPHKEVVERWQASGAQVLTTGKCGTITVTTDGQDLKINKYVKW
jgi:competence protein ComEC